MSGMKSGGNKPGSKLPTVGTTGYSPAAMERLRLSSPMGLPLFHSLNHANATRGLMTLASSPAAVGGAGGGAKTAAAGGGAKTAAVSGGAKTAAAGGGAKTAAASGGAKTAAVGGAGGGAKLGAPSLFFPGGHPPPPPTIKNNGKPVPAHLLPGGKLLGRGVFNIPAGGYGSGSGSGSGTKKKRSNRKNRNTRTRRH